MLKTIRDKVQDLLTPIFEGAVIVVALFGLVVLGLSALGLLIAAFTGGI